MTAENGMNAPLDQDGYYRPGLDGLWSVKTATHAITSRGYTTEIGYEKAREKEPSDTKPNAK